MDYFEVYASMKISRYVVYIPKVMETVFGGWNILRRYMHG